MKRLLLTHLTFIGADVPNASIDFAPRTTVIHGPSDTGKSFIGEAINYMLGGARLKEIPQLVGYSNVLLGLRMPSGDEVTLARGLQGGSFRVLAGSVRTGPLPASVTMLASKHVEGQDSNISGYLLTGLGLSGVRLRKNDRNETRSLSFRDVAHLVLIDETRIQSEQRPGLTGQRTDETAEFSVLKFLLQAQDDSALVAVPKVTDRRTASRAKVQVVEQLITSLEKRLDGVAEPSQILAQQHRLDVSMAGHSSALGQVDDARRRVLDRVGAVDAERRSNAERREELETLQARFGLLDQKYSSDLERLEMVAETGALLGLFNPGTCVFCGAEPLHQHPVEHDVRDSTQLSVAVRQEQAETLGLREGLRSTIADLARELVSLQQQELRLSDMLMTESGRLRELERELAPEQTQLTELLERRAIVQQHLADYQQLQELNALRASVEAEATVKVTPEPVADLALKVTSDFSRSIVERLTAWGYPDSEHVRYDRTDRELIAGDQARSAHGKGVRAILHAGFTLGLAQYCLDSDLPHPGLVVLDSPLVTYRPPKPGDRADPERDILPTSLVDDFYTDLSETFGGQVIVLENVSPQRPLSPGSSSVEFTKSVEGRVGFFPNP